MKDFGPQTPDTAQKISVLAGIPVYNEARYVGSVVLQAKQYADEVIVDDGSTDNTSEVAELAGATVIRQDENRGKGAAIQSILAEARKRNPDVFVLLDTDSKHNPNDIPILIKPISKGFDLVIGPREAQK
jgi:glycosyltransferase involved in cell wall biosynthesis